MIKTLFLRGDEVEVDREDLNLLGYSGTTRVVVIQLFL